MSDKRTVKEILASVETSIQYIDNHLQNIDQHLNRLNERTTKAEADCATNGEGIASNRRLIWGVLIGIVLAGLITALLTKFGIPISI